MNEQLGELRELNREVLALVDELAKGTMDTVMAALDEELGPTALLGTGPGVRGGEKGAGGGAGRVDGAPA